MVYFRRKNLGAWWWHNWPRGLIDCGWMEFIPMKLICFSAIVSLFYLLFFISYLHYFSTYTIYWLICLSNKWKQIHFRWVREGSQLSKQLTALDCYTKAIVFLGAFIYSIYSKSQELSVQAFLRPTLLHPQTWNRQGIHQATKCYCNLPSKKITRNDDRHWDESTGEQI